MTAKIYKPAKSAMQSGLANTRKWRLEFTPAAPKTPDDLMGWVGGGDPQTQVRLSFDTREEAIAYAKRHGLAYTVIEPKQRKRRIRGYADNFAYRKVG